MLTLIKKERKKRSVYIFPFGRKGQHINKQHLSKLFLTLDLKHRPCHHGLRATARTWLHDNAITYEVAEDCLAHLTGNATERAYLRSDYLEQRRSVMSEWWQFILNQYSAGCADSEPCKALTDALNRKQG